MQLKFVKVSFVFLAVFAGSTITYAQSVKPKATGKPAAKVTAVAKLVATAADIEEGKLLIAKSDCVACHHAENKMLGPAYSSIAQKYALSELNVNHLTQKVISGGSGIWGEIPMPPHPATAAADLQKMVKYILSLRAKS